MITKKDLIKLNKKLENPIDRFIITGLFYGLNSTNNIEDFLKLKKSNIDFERKMIRLKDNKLIIIDNYLHKILRDSINQRKYKILCSSRLSSQEYNLNPNSEYIIKTRPCIITANGLKPMSISGFKTRIKNISEFLCGNTILTATYLKRSGTLEELKKMDLKNKNIRQIESELRLKGYSINRNKLIEYLRDLR